MMPLPAEQLNMGQLSPEVANPGQSVRALLTRLLSGWGSNNAAGAASSPYQQAGLPPMSVGAGQAPTIYENGGLPADVVQRGRETMRAQLPSEPPPAMGDAMLDVTPPPAAIRRPAARQARAGTAVPYDTQGMDELTAALSGGGVVEGPNARIDDATRQRALAWALHNAGG